MKFKKVIEIEFIDTELGKFADTLPKALFFPFKMFFISIFKLFVSFIIICMYFIWMGYYIDYYYHKRKVYWVRLK